MASTCLGVRVQRRAVWWCSPFPSPALLKLVCKVLREFCGNIVRNGASFGTMRCESTRLKDRTAREWSQQPLAPEIRHRRTQVSGSTVSSQGAIGMQRLVPNRSRLVPAPIFRMSSVSVDTSFPFWPLFGGAHAGRSLVTAWSSRPCSSCGPRCPLPSALDGAPYRHPAQRLA